VFGKRFLFMLGLLCFSLVLASEAPQPSSDRQLLIYESELKTLLQNTMQLQRLNEKQLTQLQNLSNETEKQKIQLVDLQNKLKDFQQQILGLETELQTLRAQLKSSQQDLEILRIQLQKAEDSYKSLYESFLVYQKEVTKQINKLKAENLWLGIGTFSGWITAVAFVVFWLIEKFNVRW
jgi:chromosome segregation ATPase